MAFDSYRDFVNAFDKAGELEHIFPPVATELKITGIAAREMKPPRHQTAKRLIHFITERPAGGRSHWSP